MIVYYQGNSRADFKRGESNMNIYKNVTLRTTILKTGKAIVNVENDNRKLVVKQAGIREFEDYKDEVMLENNECAFCSCIVVDNYNDVYVVWGDSEACEMYITQLKK